MIALGMVIYVKRCDRVGLTRKHSTGIALWSIIGALFGARAFYLLQHLGYTINHPKVLFELNGATVSWGCYIGGTIGGLAYSHYHRLIPWKYMDAAASVLGLGPMIGRLACFLNGDDYGTLSRLPWAVRFPRGSYPFFDHVTKGWISPLADLSLPVHPVQLYGSLKGLLLFSLFSFLWKQNLFKPGVLFFLFWICYSICRFVLEFYRGDDDRGWVGIFSTGQFFSLLAAAISIACIFAFYGRKIELAR